MVKNGADLTMQSYTNGLKWKSGQKRQWFYNAIVHKQTIGKKWSKTGSDFTVQSYTNGQKWKSGKNGSDFTMQSYTNGQKWKSGQKRQWFYNVIIHKQTIGKKWSKTAVISQCNHTQTDKS